MITCKCGRMYPDKDLHKICECNTYIGMPIEERWQSNQTLIDKLKEKDKYIEDLERQLESKEDKSLNSFV